MTTITREITTELEPERTTEEASTAKLEKKRTTKRTTTAKLKQKLEIKANKPLSPAPSSIRSSENSSESISSPPREVAVETINISNSTGGRRASTTNLRYCLSSDPETYKGNYQLQDMGDNLYAFVQINKTKEIKGKTYPERQIFSRGKGMIESAHEFLISNVLNLKKEDIRCAGIIFIVNGQIEEWNLRSGSYNELWSGLNEDELIEFIKQVGLPMEKFNSRGHFGSSPKASNEIVAGFFKNRARPNHLAESKNITRSSADSVTESSLSPK